VDIPAAELADLERARYRRWWHGRAQLTTARRAARFVEDVAFALLFPARGVALPSLWEVSSDPDRPDDGWGEDMARMWGWKDELPAQGLAWYGRFLRGRPTLLSPELLSLLYPRDGDPGDFRAADLGPDARRIADIILASGPTPTAILRPAAGMEGKRGGARFDRALTELGRALVVTHHGVEETGTGWPSAVIELTSRAFAVPRPADAAERRRRAAARFLDTMVAATPKELSAAFGWAPAQVRADLDALVHRGVAEGSGDRYRLARPG
jgi:hypothetical protein